MIKLLLLSFILMLPHFVFAGNNTSLTNFSEGTDDIISIESACKQGFSEGWNIKKMNYEQLEITGSGKYNSAYGFRRYGNYLYYTVRSGNSYSLNNYYFTADTSKVIAYNCKSKRIQKILPKKTYDAHIINFPVYKNTQFIIFRHRAPEANYVDYSIVNLNTGESLLLSGLPGIKDGKGFDTPLYNIKRFKIQDKSLMIFTDQGGIFSFALDTFTFE